MFRCLPILFLLTSLAFGQGQKVRGNYLLFQEGCPGSGGPHCPNANPQGGPLQPVLQTTAGSIAIRFTTGSAVLAQGVEFWTKATTAATRVPIALHLASATGVPLRKPAQVGTMTVGKTLGWYRGTFGLSQLLKKGTVAFVVYTPPSLPARISPPAVQQGFKVVHHYSNSTGAWSKGIQAFHWSWKLVCPPVASLGSPPVIHAPGGGPRINQGFTLQLSIAPPSSPSLIMTGVSRTRMGPIQLPLDLKPAGAPGCWLSASMDIIAFTPASKAGIATLRFPIPNSAALIKQRFYNQALCLDGKANQLGLLFSNGGQATIGK